MVVHEQSMVVHEQSMDSPWCLHEKFLVIPWIIYGGAWFHGQSMVVYDAQQAVYGGS